MEPMCTPDRRASAKAWVPRGSHALVKSTSRTFSVVVVTRVSFEAAILVSYIMNKHLSQAPCRQVLKFSRRELMRIVILDARATTLAPSQQPVAV